MSNPLKKTMVFLGLAEEDLDAQETGVVNDPAPASAAPARQSAPRAQVTPLRKVTPTRHATTQAMNEILTVHPTEYRDAAAIAESLGNPRCMNLVLFGAMVHALGMDEIDWEQAIADTVPEKFRELNLRAYRAGRDAVR